jgi:chromosome segregation ATPase
MKIRILPTGLLFISALSLLIINGCSTSNQNTYAQLDKNNRADQTFSFYNNEDGKDIRWDVNFNDGKISSVFKNGERIPDNEIDNYSDMIYDRLDDLQDQSHHISIDLSGMKSGMKQFKDDMKKMKEELKSHHYEFNFDNEEFNNEMKKLSEELSNLKNKKIEIHFDADKFRKDMEKLKDEIKVDIHIDKDALRKNLDDLDEEIEKHQDELSHIDIDLSGLDDVLSDLGKNMGEIKIKLHKASAELKKLDGFIDKIKDEMFKDGLIKDKNEKLNLEISNSSMEVNGKKVSEDLYKKYKKMYEDYFDKKLSGENQFKIIE